MFAHVRVLTLAVMIAGGVLASFAPVHAQSHHGYGGFSGGHYGGNTGHGSGYHQGGFAPSYHPPHGYGYPAGGHYSSGGAYYQPYTWHAGATYTPAYHGVFYHTAPTRFWGGHQRRSVIRH
jgi:hypothetical protein